MSSKCAHLNLKNVKGIKKQRLTTINLLLEKAKYFNQFNCESTDSTYVLVANLKPLYWALWSRW